MKVQKFQFVLQDWVGLLSFQMQALLLTGMRGPDGSEKHNDAKRIVRYLRGVVIQPAGEWNGKNNNDFMWGDYDYFNEYNNGFWENHDHYPHHFIMHLVHCAEVVGYKHPHALVSHHWKAFYNRACLSFHMKMESEAEMDRRLNDFDCGIMDVDTAIIAAMRKEANGELPYAYPGNAERDFAIRERLGIYGNQY